MSLSVLTRYAMVFNDPTVYPIAVTNLTVTATHLKNPATGLFWHAYDESGVATWSKTASKTNEISWGRAMGWYVVACVMTLEMLPANDPGRAQVETILKDLITALASTRIRLPDGGFRLSTWNRIHGTGPRRPAP